MSEYNIEKLTSIEKDGVEFYVNSLGTKTGMSQRGLARFCGVNIKTLINLLKKVGDGQNGSKITETINTEGFSPMAKNNIPEIFSSFVDGLYLEKIETDNGAKIVKSNVCEAVIYYYGYISTSVADEVRNISKHSHRKFAQIGLHEWIKQTVGVIERHDTDELKSMLNRVLDKMDSLEKVTIEYKAIREKTTSHYMGMDQLLTELQKDNNLLEPTEDGSLSLEGYLHQNGITLSRTRFRSLAIMVSQSYKSLTGTEPEKAHFTIDNKKKYNVFVYKPVYFPMLNMCLTKAIAGQF